MSQQEIDAIVAEVRILRLTPMSEDDKKLMRFVAALADVYEFTKLAA